MSERIDAFLKAARSVATAAKAAEAAGKILEKDGAAAGTVVEACDEALSAFKKVLPVDRDALAARDEIAARGEAARTALERERALLAGQVATALGKAGLKVEGHLPLLRAGAIHLEFAFGAKGRCTLWLGPRHERLAECTLEADAIAAKVLELDRALFGGDFDEAAFLRELREAYRVCCVRAGVPEGERVPVTALMAEMAFRRQRPAFHADPVREHYSPYGRVDFATALGRVKSRRTGDRELRLDVATMTQTKRPEDHLWVPRGRSGDGAHHATAAFVKAAG
jgi:hypothetical protein